MSMAIESVVNTLEGAGYTQRPSPIDLASGEL